MEKDYAASVRRLIRDGVMYPWQTCSRTWPGLLASTPWEKIAPEAPVKRFSFVVCKRCPKLPAAFAERGVANFVRR